MGILDKLIPKNTNIFGATTPTYLSGIVDKDQLDLANKQSLFQGLLGTALGYIAQPKNQGYGSSLPYLAKSYMQGMQMAQSPYDRLERDVVMKEKFDQMALDKQREKDRQNLIANMYTTIPAETITQSTYQPIDQVGPGGERAIAPSYAPSTTEEIVLTPQQKILDKQKLVDFALKYPDQGGKFVDTITKLDELGRPQGTKQLSVAEKLQRRLPLSIEYQINKEGAVSPIGGTEQKPVDYGVERNARAAILGYDTFNLAPPDVKAQIQKDIDTAQETNAQLMGGIPVEKKGRDLVQTKLFESGERLISLNRISSLYDPSFLTWKGDIDYTVLQKKDKLGQLDPNSPEGQWFVRATQFKQQAGQDLNAYINEVTGAAIGTGEEERRIRRGTPDSEKDGPVQFESKLKNTLKVLRMTEARARYIAKNKRFDISDIPVVDELGNPTNDMPKIIKERGMELEKELLPKGEKIEDRPDIQNAIRRQVSQEFGLTQY